MNDVAAPPSYPDISGSPNAGLSNGKDGNSANGSAPGLKDSIVNSTQSAYNSVANSQTAQNLAQGPVAQSAKEQVNKTSNEFSNVAAARRTPDQKTATGQALTHYHSMFYNILSWENPRVTSIAFAVIVTFIFFTRYVPVLKYFFKASYTILGIVAAAEIAGKTVFDKGLVTQMRPRKYYTIPRETLETALEDVEQLINFFVIETQRIVFAENVYATVSAFAAALIAYFLIKFVPKWGIALITTSIVFFAPLIYIQNREFIDSQLENAGTVVNQQASQFRDLAAQHTGRASEVAKSTVSQYTAKAQDLIGQAKSKASSATTTTTANTTATTSPGTTNGTFKKEDFPNAPTDGPVGNDPVGTSPLGSGSVNIEKPSDTTPHAIPAQ